MNRKTKEVISPSHKVGIKILSDTQMANVFPNYMDVMNHIDTHRKWLKKHQIQRLERYQYNLMYDNVISVFGERGTGKTSVAFTLHKKLEDDVSHPYDIVLPIIIPEVIPADSSTLGWLLAIVKDRVDEFEKRAEEAAGCRCSDSAYGSWNRCKVSGNGGKSISLSDELDRLTELFYAAKYNPANELSYNIAVGNSVKQSQNYYEFAKAIVEFWDHWIEMIREVYTKEENGRKDIVPLIYFVFDDVDLAPEKVDELLSIIIKYLSHPNIIVIATADEEMFLEVIEERLDRDIGRLPKEWRDYLRSHDTSGNGVGQLDGVPGELVRKTARRYLGKVMPTSTRYYLKLFNTVEEKHLFHLDSGKGLWEGVCEQIHILNQYAKYNNPEGSIQECFLTEGQINRDYYLYFFGNTSRQIGNAYIGIKDMISALCLNIQMQLKKSAQKQEEELEAYIEAVYNTVWRFLYISVNSNHDLAERIEEVEKFISEMFWKQHNEWYLFVNYAYLDDYLRSQIGNGSCREWVKLGLQLYALFHFAENIFLILEKCTPQGIVGRKKIHGITCLQGFLRDQVFHGRSVFRRHMDGKDFFAHYRIVLNRIDRLMEDGIEDKKQNREYFYDLKNLEETITDEFISDVFRKDQDWLGEIAGMLSAVYGNLYQIGKEEIKNCMLYAADEPLFLYQKNIKDSLENNIYTTLDHFDCFKTAQEGLKQWDADLDETGDARNKVCDLKEKYVAEWLEKDPEVSEEEQTSGETETEKEDKIQIIELSKVFKTARIDLDEMRLVDLLNLLPPEESIYIKQRLKEDQTRGGMLSVLKMLYNSIAEWDEKIDGIYIRNVVELNDLAYEYGMGSDAQRELGELVEFIYQYVPEEFEAEAGMSWYIQANKVYKEIKNYCSQVRYYFKNGLMSSQEAEVAERQLGRIEQRMDATIRLKNAEEIREAITLAARVQLAMRIQRFYLYYSIKEKYDHNYEYTSKDLSEKKTGKKEKNNTYYFELYRQMDELVECDQEKLDQEKKMLRYFIRSAAAQSRNDYIRDLLQEVNYGSGSD